MPKINKINTNVVVVVIIVIATLFFVSPLRGHGTPCWSSCQSQPIAPDGDYWLSVVPGVCLDTFRVHTEPGSLKNLENRRFFAKSQGKPGILREFSIIVILSQGKQII